MDVETAFMVWGYTPISNEEDAAELVNKASFPFKVGYQMTNGSIVYAGSFAPSSREDALECICFFLMQNPGMLIGVETERIDQGKPPA